MTAEVLILQRLRKCLVVGKNGRQTILSCSWWLLSSTDDQFLVRGISNIICSSRTYSSLTNCRQVHRRGSSRQHEVTLGCYGLRQEEEEEGKGNSSSLHGSCSASEFFEHLRSARRRTKKSSKMSNLMRLVVNNYNEILEAKKELMVDSWPMMASPGPMLCIVGTYLAFVLKIGPKMMEKRPAFQLNSLLIAYNAFQVAFSIWLTLLSVYQPEVRSVMFSPKCNNYSGRSPLDLQIQASVSRAAWWYAIAKLIELLDTVFFVLRKKQNQVTFLHVYHHTMTAVFSWCYLKFLPGEQGALVGSLNSFVHIVMYSYYLIAALGPQYRKYLWWKKYMTWIQLIQFVIMLSYLVTILAMDCKVPKALTYFFMTNMVIFIYLFSDFYRKAYTKKNV